MLCFVEIWSVYSYYTFGFLMVPCSERYKQTGGERLFDFGFKWQRPFKEETIRFFFQILLELFFF